MKLNSNNTFFGGVKEMTKLQKKLCENYEQFNRSVTNKIQQNLSTIFKWKKKLRKTAQGQKRT